MRINKHVIFLLILYLHTVLNSIQAQNYDSDTLKTKRGNIIIHPVFHGSLVLEMDKKTIYIDPYNGASRYKNFKSPDLIIITHQHGDHWDKKTLNELNTANTKFIAPKNVADSLKVKFGDKVFLLKNGDKNEFDNVTVEAIPMYNLPEDSEARHKKGIGNGYIITYGNKRIYISGDTEDITEMRALKNIDVAFVCMNQPYTMTIDQAADAVSEFKPQIMYPYHYRNKDGLSDIEAFKKLVTDKNKNIDIRIRNWYLKL